ncbi:HNH endonuclease [Streptomyces sp. H39-C1]|uniref:HNH endonuclease n=1 Tax=Streptomyces sp. H39-C1 TaxID=3004355 RepID=UPI0022AF0AFF|nr:HNH endonuclease signature motif containing protein [Streptomyces sp. H39-C1]MCZ4103410.1 HNH endonuclease signature motif containing protein [Streptomyces sp. H39-C1]
MQHLDPPAFDARDVYTTCIANARFRTRKRLEAFTDDVADAAEVYEGAARGQALHTLTGLAAQPHALANRKVLEGVYTDRMVRERSPGRRIYEALRGTTDDEGRRRENRCPLCGEGLVTTLDHHLPKSHYPLLSVVPVNLVPACGDCNKIKLDTIPSSAGDQTLHPYFDDFSHYAWLRARIRRPRGSEKLSVKFFVAPHPEWDATLTARLGSHLKVFDLDFRYSLLVSSHIAATNHELMIMPSKYIAPMLARRAEGWRCRGNPNTMGCALFKALAADEWYVNGGWGDPSPGVNLDYPEGNLD